MVGARAARSEFCHPSWPYFYIRLGHSLALPLPTSRNGGERKVCSPDVMDLMVRNGFDIVTCVPHPYCLLLYLN